MTYTGSPLSLKPGTTGRHEVAQDEGNDLLVGWLVGEMRLESADVLMVKLEEILQVPRIFLNSEYPEIVLLVKHVAEKDDMYDDDHDVD